MKLFGIKFKRNPGRRIALTDLPEGMIAILQGLIHMANKLQKWIIITSLNDSKHSDNSFHYKNLAVDIRVWNLGDGDVEAILHYFNAVPFLYDAVFEKNHIHIEFDPK